MTGEQFTILCAVSMIVLVAIAGFIFKKRWNKFHVGDIVTWDDSGDKKRRQKVKGFIAVYGSGPFCIEKVVDIDCVNQVRNADWLSPEIRQHGGKPHNPRSLRSAYGGARYAYMLSRQYNGRKEFLYLESKRLWRPDDGKGNQAAYEIPEPLLRRVIAPPPA